ncbi:prolipoprotein diacylglyceryl transferase [Candidatus Woesearchaeota archaeon]|nr:prolipoprotein diacylglyceryl transferase [Candidatus Woesearchaeota archaeon]|tara:strand:+ start:18851 stop:19606 length:756 start_codon:yes stop_codon:yes gene_type:complete
MFYHNIDPVLIGLGPFQIRYYGLIFVFGIFLTYLIFKHLAKKRQLPLSNKDFDDYILYGVVGVLVGARLGSVISDFSFYAANPLQIFAVWNGGLAFHGGLIGLVIAGYYYSKRKNISFYDVADLTAIPLAFALGLGRIANFINGEFYGTVTNLPWAVQFQGVEGFRHPVQLYESAKNFLIFAVLWHVKTHKLPRGMLFWMFITLYGGFRFSLEFYKDLPPYLLNLTWGQVWSLPMFVIGGYMLYKLVRKKN